MNRTPLAFALVTAALLLPRLSPAQPTAEAAAAARAAFMRGVAEAQAERFASAAAAFEQSYGLNPTTVALYNLASATSRTGRLRQAITAYERYLREGGATLPAERVRLVEANLIRLRGELATVVLRVVPVDVAVEVDGRVETPAEGRLQLDPGAHVVTLTAAGHTPLRQEITLTAAGTQVVEARLAPLPVAEPTPPVVAVVPPPPVARPVLTPHPAEAPRASSTPITARWWFWTGLGVVVLGAALGAMAGAGVFTTDQAPVSGTAFDVQAIEGR
jgi:hypothetical protein